MSCVFLVCCSAMGSFLYMFSHYVFTSGLIFNLNIFTDHTQDVPSHKVLAL